jgi:hypothetical protein
VIFSFSDPPVKFDASYAFLLIPSLDFAETLFSVDSFSFNISPNSQEQRSLEENENENPSKKIFEYRMETTKVTNK